jgi:hypothetical protein
MVREQGEFMFYFEFFKKVCNCSKMCLYNDNKIMQEIDKDRIT